MIHRYLKDLKMFESKYKIKILLCKQPQAEDCPTETRSNWNDQFSRGIFFV